ncbi:MAG TPA: queuosine precursor transporter [Gammaproteobacteria bacterium]|nr:queuosine precursor transporter [Gammaproteobacteria bacterium]
MDNLIRESIYWLQIHASAEALTIWTFALCAIAILALLRFYGAFGLYVYNALAIVLANIQVLRFTQYDTFTNPVALGTVLFTTTFFVNDVLTEHYGSDAAKRSVTLGFWAQVLVSACMILALGHPLPALIETSATLQEAQSNAIAMLQLFAPSLRILTASLIAYFSSQWLDIFIFSRLRNVTKGKFLWLRQNIAMFTSGIFDTFLFSFLAWMVFSDTPITWHELFFTYILSAQAMRFILNVAFTPLMYMSYRCVPKTNLRIYDIKARSVSV